MAYPKLHDQDHPIVPKTGLSADINATATTGQATTGELLYTTDTKTLYVFDGTNCLPIANVAPIETVTASSDTLDETNHVVLCDCTSNTITINLPTASGISGRIYHIKKIDSSANAVTIDGNGGETVDGTTTKVLSSQYDSVMIVSDGSNWLII